MKIDPRFLKTEGVEAFTGNELLVKGALEAGVALVTGYPGSPVSEVFDVLETVSPYLKERGVVAQIANNEALATARLNGARQAGLRAMAVMKSVGLHVGADGLAVGNLMEVRQPRSGCVAVVGDDPWNETTQINSDSRYLSKHLHMPLLEPSTFQEIKDWLAHAFELSGKSDLYLTYLVTTNQADGGGTVQVHPHPELPVNRLAPETLLSASLRISDSVMIPPHTSMREATLAERFERLLTLARTMKLNERRGDWQERGFVGFVAAGMSYCYLEEVLKLLGLWEHVPVLKVGMTYPLDRAEVLAIAERVDHLIVVEEKRGFLESQIAEIIIASRQEGRLPKPPALWGKKFPNDVAGFPVERGLNASVVLEVLGSAFEPWKDRLPFLDTQRLERELAEIRNTNSLFFNVPTRTPTFCPGCPHRDSAVVSLKMKKKLADPVKMAQQDAKPMDIVFHGESGCHSMLQFAPNEGLMQNYSGMGLGGGTGAGMSPFVTNSQVVFLGDSTFFHSGLVAVSDSIKNSQNITYVILENGTTAMTGHQPTPGNDVDIMGNPTVAQNIERVLRGLAPQGLFIQRINPAERERYQAMLEDIVQKPGVKVVIADKECAITLHRRKNAEKRKILNNVGFLAREERINITPEVCENCLECTRQTGCPGLTVEATPFGPKIATDLSTCVDDAACARTKACPSFERVVIERSKPAAAKQSALPEITLLDPVRVPMDDRWCAYTAGVGGMGAGVVNAVLVRAGMKEGYSVMFLDKKGLAIRNGGVYGHVVFSKDLSTGSPVIPYAKADLLVGLDLLEAARGLDGRMNLRVAHPARTHAVVNTHKHHTVLSLIGRADFDPDKLEDVIRSKSKLGQFLAHDFSLAAERLFGSKLYANMMLLGAAYQRGWIPLSEANLMAAIGESVRKSEVDINIRAFQWGRAVAQQPALSKDSNEPQTLTQLIDQKAGYLRAGIPWFGQRRERAYRRLVEQAFRWMDLPADAQMLLARTVYDLFRYGGSRFAENYLQRIWNMYRRDQQRYDYRATRIAALGLFRVMAIKDEVWVARLLTSPEKYERDRTRYNIDASRGDRISYVHLNRPQFTVLGKNIEFDLESRDWMLRIMARMGFLRRLLPAWHKREKEFRAWYEHLVDNFTYFDSEQDYDFYVQALSVHESVTGYRDIRYPRMDEAVAKAEALVKQIGAARTESRPTPAKKPTL